MRIKALFEQLSEARLTVNLAKCEFAQLTVMYLGHVVGQGKVAPVDFPSPPLKKTCGLL